MAATRYGIAVLDDRPRLLGRRRRLGQLLEREQPAVGRRVLVEQDLLRPLARLDVQQRVQPLDRLAGDQHGAVEPVGVGLALAQVARDLRLQRPRRVAEQAELLDDRLRRRGSAAALTAFLRRLLSSFGLRRAPSSSSCGRG